MKLLAVDLGASGGRALVGELLDGGSMRLEEVHRFPHAPVYLPHDAGRTLHWDIPLLWAEVLTGLRQAALAGHDIRSIGLDTWGVDFALIDREGHLMGDPVAYRDGRTAGMVDLACSRVPREEIFRRTGLQFMELNTLYQLLGLQAQNLPWLVMADRLLMMPDLFHYWLCGSKSVEFTNASTTQFVNASTREWDRELLARLGLPDHFLPDLVQAGTPLGGLRPWLAEETGLSPSVQVVCPATHDTASAVIATPGVGEDWAFLSAGTWCLFGAEVRQPYLTPDVLADGFGNEGGAAGTTRLLRNITGLWLVQECRRTWKEEGRDLAFSDLAGMAEKSRPFLAILDPDDPRFVQPSRMPATIAGYCRATGQSVPETPGEFVRVCLEGIALAVRRRWEQLQRILGRQLRVLHVVGGGSRNRLLCRFLADCLGVPVLTGPAEATAMGNLLCQAVGMGALRYYEVRVVARASIDLEEFLPGERGPWDEAMARAPWGGRE